MFPIHQAHNTFKTFIEWPKNLILINLFSLSFLLYDIIKIYKHIFLEKDKIELTQRARSNLHFNICVFHVDKK